MSNIAFLTLIVLVMAFPGYVLRASYNVGPFSSDVLPKSWTDDIARAVLYSLPLHLFWITIFECLQHNQITHSTLTFEIVFRVFIGRYDNALSAVAGTLYQNKWYVVAYYSIVLASSFMVGHLFRLAVWRWKLDVMWPWLLGFDNKWLYTLYGRDVPIPPEYAGGKVYVQIDALTNIPSEEKDKTRLYRGFVEAFTTEENGALRDIFIKDAQRGKFIKGEGKESRFEWKPVTPGS